MSSTREKFTGFTKESIHFLSNLELNNNKIWFEANRQLFTSHVIRSMQHLAQDLHSTMATIDPGLETRKEKVISRIYRDTRFSHNKSPYKTTIWITYKRNMKNWQDCPAYFFELANNSYRYGMGFYAAAKITMDVYREHIIRNRDNFLKRFNHILIKNNFEIEGDIYKKVLPNDLPEGFQTWYQRKNIYFVCNNQINAELFSNKLVSRLKKGFKELAPLYYFLLRACPKTYS